MSITIRLAKPEDALEMAEVHMRSWEVAYKGIISEEFIQEKNSTRQALFKRIITNDNKTNFVLQYNNKTVGIMTVDCPRDDDVSDDCYELKGIYLHPDYYRMGIGTKSVEFAFDLALGLGKHQMTVWVLADNINAIKFYEKCGFIADGKSKTLEYGKTLNCIRMKKDL